MQKAQKCNYRDYIRETAQEYQRRGNFIRIYPTKRSANYDQFFEQFRSYNHAVYNALYTDQIIPKSYSTPQQKVKENEGITQADLMIEYLSRVHNALEPVAEEHIPAELTA